MEAPVSVETATGRRQWSLRDIPLAVRLAFDLEKLGTGALGLTAAALAYGTFHWLGAATGEKQAHRVFAALGWIGNTDPSKPPSMRLRKRRAPKRCSALDAPSTATERGLKIASRGVNGL